MVSQAQPTPARGDPFERDRARLNRYREYEAFFDGEQWESRRRRGVERMTLNYARALVRKVVSYVFPEPVTFSIPPAATPGDAGSDGELGPEGPDLVRAAAEAANAAGNRVETILAETLDELDAASIDFEMAMDAAVLGDGAIKVTWDTAAKRPRLAAVDPATLLAWWRPDLPNEAYRFQQHYQLPGAAIIAGGLAGAGSELDLDKLYPVVEDWTADRWQVTVAGQVSRNEANPYGWLPYLVLPNNRRAKEFWGESDLIDLMDVCRQLNKRASVLADILDLSGYPIAVLENVEGSDGIAVGPGAKWEIPADAKAYLLDLLQGGGVGLHIDYVGELRTTLHDLAETPRTAFGEAGRAVSGAALETELQPLVQKVRRKRRGLDSIYRRRNAMLLDLLERFGGQPIGGLRRTVALWPPILPTDREVEARVAAQLVASNIQSRRTSAAELGIEDPEAELSRIIEEAQRLAAAAPQPQDGGGKGGDNGAQSMADAGQHDGGRVPGGDRTQRDGGDQQSAAE